MSPAQQTFWQAFRVRVTCAWAVPALLAGGWYWQASERAGVLGICLLIPGLMVGLGSAFSCFIHWEDHHW